jgi:quinol monooxygenase YgiN
MLIVSGWLSVDPAAREQYLDGCLEVMRLAREAPGCLDFALTADPLLPDRINVYERWESDEQLAVFRGSGPSSEQQAEIRDAYVRRNRIAAVEDP